MPDSAEPSSAQISPEQPPVTQAAPVVGVVATSSDSSFGSTIITRVSILSAGDVVDSRSSTTGGCISCRGKERAAYASTKLPIIKSDAPSAAYIEYCGYERKTFASHSRVDKERTRSNARGAC